MLVVEHSFRIFVIEKKNYTMRVLIVNTSEKTGGAAVAANRLMEALNNNGVKAKMLVADKQTDNITVVELPHPGRHRFHFLWERWRIFWHLHFSRAHLFEIDTASSGSDITSLPEYKEADVIHLAWINQGMLSLKDIRKILEDGKPVVWTMHDMWPATAICHVTLSCNNFTTHCHHCRLLPGGGSKHDLSYKVWNRKAKILGKHAIKFVTCSKWLAGEARRSRLLMGQDITTIPNPIDTRLFHPGDQRQARLNLHLPLDKKLILFASQRVTNTLKGMDYLVEACNKLVGEHPEIKDQWGVAVMGGHAEEIEDLFQLPVYPMGYISDQRLIAQAYHAADVFVLPSLSENLPNTIMEAMACGVPCVGFHVGGIPEMIDHGKDGYVAKYRSADDLAAGIYWTLHDADREQLGREAVNKVERNYSQQSVAVKYIEVYTNAIAQRTFKL